MISSPKSLRRVAFISALAVICTVTRNLYVLADNDAQTSSKKCLVEDDLDFKNCHMEDLSTESLQAICTKRGADMDNEILPHILAEYDEEGQVTKAAPTEFTHMDYVAGAYECLGFDEDDYDDDDDYGDDYGDDDDDDDDHEF